MLEQLDQTAGGVNLSKTQMTPTIRYNNPIPVVVALVPVHAIDEITGEDKIGLLTVRRAIEPKSGALALPGGYLEYEDWRHALIRELREETGLDVGSEDTINLASAESVEGGKRLLLFGKTKTIEEASLKSFVPNTESSELCVIFEPTELAFPVHTEEARKFFASKGPVKTEKEILSENLLQARELLRIAEKLLGFDKTEPRDLNSPVSMQQTIAHMHIEAEKEDDGTNWGWARIDRYTFTTSKGRVTIIDDERAGTTIEIDGVDVITSKTRVGEVVPSPTLQLDAAQSVDNELAQPSDSLSRGAYASRETLLRVKKLITFIKKELESLKQ